MTYFSDYDCDYYDDEDSRKEIFRQLDDLYLNPYYEKIPDLEEFFDE